MSGVDSTTLLPIISIVELPPVKFKGNNLIGRKIERLIVTGWAFCRNEDHYWFCCCSCGNVKCVYGDNLSRELIRSCGCLRRELSAAKALTHGHTVGRSDGIPLTPEYACWLGMRVRCTNSGRHSYENYGGRGICVCERWDSFEAFLADMGSRPTSSHSIERKDNSKGYEPDNCVWATDKDQCRNRRSNAVFEFRGRSQCVAAWAEEVGAKYHTVYARYKRGTLDQFLMERGI